MSLKKAAQREVSAGAGTAIIALVLLGVVALGATQMRGERDAVVPPLKGAIPAAVRWEPSFDAALAKAKTTNTPIMIDFGASWCPACRQLDGKVLTQKPVIAETTRFVNVKIDTDLDPALAARFKVSALPTLVWLNAEGREVGRIEGAPAAKEMPGLLREAFAKTL